jgi:hypothetical protein
LVLSQILCYTYIQALLITRIPTPFVKFAILGMEAHTHQLFSNAYFKLTRPLAILL